MKALYATLILPLIATPLWAETEHREMDAHVHGVSQLKLAVEGDHIEIWLTSPGMDLVGFEHVPNSDDEKGAVVKALRILEMPDAIVSFPPDAGCRPIEVQAQYLGDTDTHEHDADQGHDNHEGEQHSAFRTRQRFMCNNLPALSTISFPFFESFENAKEIEAEFVTEKGAGKAEIDRDTAELTLN